MPAPRDLLFDMDGIIVRVQPYVIERFNADKGTSFTSDDITSWDMDDILGDPKLVRSYFSEVGFFRGLPPMPGALHHLKRLYNARDGKGGRRFNVMIATTPWKTSHSASEKLEWLEEHAPWFPRRNVNLIHDKHRFSADLLVDDKPENLELYKRHNPNALVATIDHPYNRHVWADARFNGHNDPSNAWDEMTEWLLRYSNDKLSL